MVTPPRSEIPITPILVLVSRWTQGGRTGSQWLICRLSGGRLAQRTATGLAPLASGLAPRRVEVWAVLRVRGVPSGGMPLCRKFAESGKPSGLTVDAFPPGVFDD
jgi:hypothetical protein